MAGFITAVTVSGSEARFACYALESIVCLFDNHDMDTHVQKVCIQDWRTTVEIEKREKALDDQYGMNRTGQGPRWRA